MAKVFTCPRCGGHQWSSARTPEDSARAAELAKTSGIHPMAAPLGMGMCVGYVRDMRGVKTRRCGFQWDRTTDDAKVFAESAPAEPKPTKPEPEPEDGPAAAE